MNKFVIYLLAILGGFEVTFYIFTPIILATVWISVFEVSTWTYYTFFIMGSLATIFRSIKIGFLKN